MCRRKHFAVFLVVLLVASFSVWAFPGRKAAKEQETLAVSTMEVQKSTEKEALPESSVQKSDLKELPKSSEIQAKSEESIFLAEDESATKEEKIEKLAGLLYEQVNDQLEAESDIEKLITEKEELLKKNGEQADELAYTRGLLDKATSTKAFAKVNAVMGFEEKLPTWGIGGELGLKTGSGFILSAGADYMIGDFSSPIDFKWDLDNLSLSLGVGWEW